MSVCVFVEMVWDFDLLFLEVFLVLVCVEFDGVWNFFGVEWLVWCVLFVVLGYVEVRILFVEVLLF